MEFLQSKTPLEYLDINFINDESILHEILNLNVKELFLEIYLQITKKIKFHSSIEKITLYLNDTLNHL